MNVQNLCTLCILSGLSNLRSRAPAKLLGPRRVVRLLAALGLFTPWAIAPAAHAAVTLTTLHSFIGPDGANAVGGLVRGSDGNFYGMTQYGGLGWTGTNSSGTGTVFRITHEGTLSNMYRFSAGLDGGWPQAGLAQGSDGNFYGSTGGGGSYGSGTVFQMTPLGQFSSFYSVDGSLGYISSALVAARNGNFYTMGGWPGGSGQGTLFSLTPGGLANVLVSFSGTNGFPGWDSDVLIQGTDGNFYGTTQLGGAEFTGVFGDDGQGTAFVLTPDGTLTTLVSFSGTNGSVPTALVQGKDGNLYGTTYEGGLGFLSNSANEYAGYGSVFKLSTNGILTTLAFFNRTNGGGHPQSLMQASDGNLYGTTYDNGTNGGYGSIFKVTTTGLLTSLFQFNRTNGANPYYAPLLQDTDGSFYGTTFNGGASNRGTIFRLTLTPTPPQLTLTPAEGTVILSWPTNSIGFILQSTTNLGSLAVWTTNSQAPVIINGQNTVTNPASGTQRFYRLSQ
jgi:uncharacterized repeat protein (TIGR03803 family)